MFVCMIYNKAPEEGKVLKEIVRDVIAHLTEEEMRLFCVKLASEVNSVLEREPLLDCAFVDVSDDMDIELLRRIRNSFAQSELLLVADMEISPMKYLAPDIRAASLLLRPFNKEQCERTVREFFHTVLAKREKPDEKKVLLVKNRSGKIAIPFQKIYYIEARERKIFVRLRNMEYCEYETLDHIMSLLPERFLQCHRSFVFNTEHLQNVKLSEGMVYLEHGLMIPVSRSYRKSVKEFLNELRGI